VVVVCALSTVQYVSRRRPAPRLEGADYSFYDRFTGKIGQLAHLWIDALAVHRYPRIAIFHARLYDGNLCKGKAFCYQRPKFVA
jgi:hypothetical protein